MMTVTFLLYYKRIRGVYLLHHRNLFSRSTSIHNLELSLDRRRRLGRLGRKLGAVRAGRLGRRRRAGAGDGRGTGGGERCSRVGRAEALADRASRGLSGLGSGVRRDGERAADGVRWIASKSMPSILTKTRTRRSCCRQRPSSMRPRRQTRRQIRHSMRRKRRHLRGVSTGLLLAGKLPTRSRLAGNAGSG